MEIRSFSPQLSASGDGVVNGNSIIKTIPVKLVEIFEFVSLQFDFASDKNCSNPGESNPIIPNVAILLIYP